MVAPNLLENNNPVSEQHVTPAPTPAGEHLINTRPSLNNSPVAIKDLTGEVWTLNSAMGKMLENTAKENGVRPEYLTQQELDAYNSNKNQPKIDTVKGPDGKPVSVETNFNVLPKNPITKTDESSTFYQQGLIPIKSMQQALIDLSKDIATHNIMSAGNVTNDNGDLLNGSDAFLNFLITSYMNTAKTTGKQLVDANEKQPIRMDTAKINDNFKGVLNTITRIGGAGNEKSPDGNWGPRTNNALKQIYSLAYALVKVAEDMGVELSRIYTEQDLTDFYNNIPAEPNQINLNEKVKKAQVLTINLGKLRGLYDSFREKIFNNPTYNAHISQTKPLFVRNEKETSAQPLSKQEQSLYEKYKVTRIDIKINNNSTFIMPYHLSNINAFVEYLKINGNNMGLTSEQLAAINQGDKTVINKLLRDVVDSLSGEQ